MNPKPRPNHRVYLQALRGMSPQQRLAKTIELSDSARRLFRDGLRKRFPNLAERDLHRLYLERLDKCHNRNY